MKLQLADVLKTQIISRFLGGIVYYTSPKNGLDKIPMLIESIYLGNTPETQIMIYTPSPVPTFPPPPALLGFELDTRRQAEELPGNRIKFHLVEGAECLFCPPSAKEYL